MTRNVVIYKITCVRIEYFGDFYSIVVGSQVLHVGLVWQSLPRL